VAGAGTLVVRVVGKRRKAEGALSRKSHGVLKVVEEG
jgi:hypothetical protein